MVSDFRITKVVFHQTNPYKLVSFIVFLVSLTLIENFLLKSFRIQTLNDLIFLSQETQLVMNKFSTIINKFFLQQRTKKKSIVMTIMSCIHRQFIECIVEQTI